MTTPGEAGPAAVEAELLRLEARLGRRLPAADREQVAGRIARLLAQCAALDAVPLANQDRPAFDFTPGGRPG